jgi:hypothetical protein
MDESLFKKVSDKYKEITGIKSAQSEKPAGSILEWAYFQYGVPALSANLWSIREDTAKRPQMRPQKREQSAAAPSQKPTQDRAAMMRQFMTGQRGTAATGRTAQGASSADDEKWLKWIDTKNDKKGFAEWTKFNHKQLGEVEIGGFFPYLKTNPSAKNIEKLSKSHAEFALFLATQFAEITMDEPEVKKLSSDVFELKIKIHNKGKFTYCTAMGQRTRNITPITLQLKFEDDDKMKLFGGTKRNDLATLEAGAEKEYKWIIISPPGKKIDIKLWARNGGGTTVKKVVLK